MCRDGHGKLSAVGIVPLQSAEAAAKEVEHIAKLGLKGACFRPERYKGLALYDDSLKPFWERIAGNGLFAAVHGSFGALMPSFATGRYDNLFFSHMICHPFEQMAACLDIIAGGVLERHPDLRACLTDQVVFLAGGSRVLPMAGLIGRLTLEQSDALVAQLRDFGVSNVVQAARASDARRQRHQPGKIGRAHV